MATKHNYTKEKIAQDISSLWGNLPQDQLDLLLLHIDIHQFKKNEVIYRNLETPTHMMYLIQGKVKVFKEGMGGKNQIIRVIKPYEFFAYRAYFASENYRTAAMAIEDSTVASFPISLLVRLMENNFKVSLFFIKYLCFEIGKSDDRTLNLTQKHVRSRLAEALLMLKETYGVEEDGITLSIRLGREDLADISCMTTSNAIRTLSGLANEQIIATKGKAIQILNEEELRKISDQG